jgi:hypothetical protein
MMNKKEILNRISGIISELHEQFDYMSHNSEHLNDLELELFAANADFLSDHISILIKLNAESTKTSNAVVSVQQQKPVIEELTNKVDEIEAFEDEETVINIPEWKFDIKEEVIETFDFEDKSAEDLFDRPLTEEEMRVIDEKTKLKSIPEEQFITEVPFVPIVSQIKKPVEEVKYTETEIQNKTVEKEGQSPTLNEILSTQTQQNTVSGQFNQRQVRDLKSLINLNDKLQFVRDLFNGYSLAYSEAIELINRFDSFDAADNFLKQNYAVKNNWVEKQDVADKFYEILNRRFAS